MSDTLDTLGTIIDATAGRDAVHFAVEPCVAAERLTPGQHVGFVNMEEGVGMGVCAKPVGIVDPFLKAPVQKGQYFWVIVYPKQITGLRHVWTHPAIDATKGEERVKVKAEKSEAWLRDFIERSDCPSYDITIAVASGEKVVALEGYDDSYKEGDYLHFSGWDAHGEIPPEFWDHVENVTGKKIPSNERPSYFSCSC